MLRRIATAVLLAGVLAAPAGAVDRVLLMPGVTYERRVEFTRHGPVVIHVIEAPRPGGLHALRPVLSNNAIAGREKVTSMQRRVSGGQTVAGVNGDMFRWVEGYPSGVLIQGGVLHAEPHPGRSSVGIDAEGGLHVDRVAFFGTWQGTGQRRPFQNVNRPPGANGVTLYTSAWGPATPATPGSVEAVLFPFPATTPNADLSGPVVQIVQGGATPIPIGGAVLVARGGQGPKLVTEAPVGTTVTVRMILRPDWTGVVEAIGGGPVLVRDGRPVFRASEEFTPFQLLPRHPRTAVGQRADRRILLVAVDGRQPGYSTGMTNFELARALAGLGAVTASALDAGGSTTMAFDGTLLNRPSDRAGERPIADALFVFYYGVHAPPAAEPVLSPNGDGVAERQSLSYKVVRPATVTASLVGPDGVARFTESVERQPGVYRFSFSGDAFGSPLVQGRWRWSVTAVDDQGQRSEVDRAFWLNGTLGFLRVRPAILRLRPRGSSSLLATFTLANRARVTATVETATGALMRTLVRSDLDPGEIAIAWNGRDQNRLLVHSSRYVLRVVAVNAFGPAELATSFSVRRVAPLKKRQVVRSRKG